MHPDLNAALHQDDCNLMALIYKACIERKGEGEFD